MNPLPVSLFLAERIVRLIAMIAVASPVGCCRAWFARFMGDPTAEEQGYMTLNPFQHIPFIGFIMLLFLPFGIINVIPINPANYHDPHRRIKIGAVAFSGVVSYFLLAVIALIVLTLFVGPNLIPAVTMTWVNVIIIFIQTCIFFAVLEFFMYSVLLLAMPLLEENMIAPHYVYLALIIVPLILILAFGDTIQHILGYGIVFVAQLLTHLFGGV